MLLLLVREQNIPRIRPNYNFYLQLSNSGSIMLLHFVGQLYNKTDSPLGEHQNCVYNIHNSFVLGSRSTKVQLCSGGSLLWQVHRLSSPPSPRQEPRTPDREMCSLRQTTVALAQAPEQPQHHLKLLRRVQSQCLWNTVLVSCGGWQVCIFDDQRNLFTSFEKSRHASFWMVKIPRSRWFRWKAQLPFFRA